MSQVTTMDLNAVPKDKGAVDYTQDFFGKPAYLTVTLPLPLSLPLPLPLTSTQTTASASRRT